MANTKTLRRHFTAPWSWTVWILTIGASGALLLGAVVSGSLFVQVLLGSIFVGCLAFGVRGYSVADGQILVHRLSWATRFDVENLRSVEMSPGVMTGSLRSFGNGGFFGVYGRFRNAVLGSYRAYATSGDNAVVLQVKGTGTIVVTPDAPAAFVETIRAEQSSA